MSTSHVQFLTSAHKNIRQVKPIEQLIPVYVEHSNNSSNKNNKNNNLNLTMGVSNTRNVHCNLINNTQINGHSTRLLPQTVQEHSAFSARRSLFGSPKPGEIKNLYNENVQRERDRFMDRFGFDIFTEKFINDNDITVSEKPTSRIFEGQDISSNTNCNYNNSKTKNLENNLLNGEDRLHEQNNDEKNNSKLNLNKKNNHINLIENSNCNKLNNNEKCDENNHIINNNNNNNNNSNNSNNECNNINEIINSNKIQQSISTTSTQTTPLKDKKSSLTSCERSKPYSTLTRQSRISDYYASRKKILTFDTPKPQKAKLTVEDEINELQQNIHEKLEGGQKF